MTSYKIKLTYADGYMEEMAVSSDWLLEWVDSPKAISLGARESMTRCLDATCRWLKANGGTKLEVEEEEEPAPP